MRDTTITELQNHAHPFWGSLVEKTSDTAHDQGPVSEPGNTERSGRIGVSVFLDRHCLVTSCNN